MDRRVHTEEWEYEDLDTAQSFPYDNQMKFGHDTSDSEADEQEEQIDHNNYKGIYFDDEADVKIRDLETGAHFDYNEMWKILEDVEKDRRDKEKKEQMNEKDNIDISTKNINKEGKW